MLLRISFLIVLKQDIKIFLAVFNTFSYINSTLWFLSFFFRLRQHSIERAIELTDSFTWEDLPTRDADTGYLTLAGWIPLIKLFSTRTAVALTLFHFIQSTVRIATNHETFFIAWYPFDWSISPFYELVNISQVTISKTTFSFKLFL
jgi:hypothetical protein